LGREAAHAAADTAVLAEIQQRIDNLACKLLC
jgi:hypothetical protein